MNSVKKNDKLEQVNLWLLRVSFGCALVYFMLMFKTQAFPYELSLNKLPVNGELSLTGIALGEKKDKISRLKEFNYIPDSRITLSSLILQKEAKTFRVELSVQDLGENDVAARLALDLGMMAVSDIKYVKIPHITSLTDYTLRSNNTFTIRLMPLYAISVPIVASEEDKVGKVTSNSLSQLLNVGQKEHYWSAGFDAAWKRVNLSLVYENSQLKQPQIGSDLKSTTLVLQNAQDEKDMYYGLTYNTTDISSRVNGINSIELKKWKFEASHNITEALNVEGSYASNKRTNKNAGTISTDAKSYALGATYNFKEWNGTSGSALSVGYKKETKDYTNADIASEDVKTWNVSGRTKYRSVTLKGNYEKSNKDVTGASAALQNFNELAYSAKSWGVSLSKTAIRPGQIGVSYYLKRNVKEPALVSGYGITSYRTNVNGVTATYILSPKATFSYNWALTEWRKTGSFKYKASPNVDAVLSVFENNEFHQGVMDYAWSDKTSFSAGYWESNSDQYDSIQTNQTREQEFSLSGNHAFNDKMFLSLILKRNIYKDPLNATFEGQTNYAGAELTTKF